MEKYLRLLHPKTINFESAPTGSHGALTMADVCVAMSYAKLTAFEENLIKLKCLGANTYHNVNLFAQLLLAKYRDQLLNAGVSSSYHFPIIKVALYEFCLVAADYKPTERNREVLSGFSDSTVRKHMKQHINHVLNDLNAGFEAGSEKIFFQLDKTN